MKATAAAIKPFIELYFRNGLVRSSAAVIRPVFVGLPDEAIDELFSLITNNSQIDWYLDPATPQDVVAVLAVKRSPAPSGSAVSKECGWDYAVAVRNSTPLVLILASNDAWDTRPESLANTTETINGVGGAMGGIVQSHLAQTVSSRLGLPLQQMQQLFRLVRVESAKLNPTARDEMAWDVIEALLTIPPLPTPIDAACYAAGIPFTGHASLGFADSYSAIQGVGIFMAAQGFRSAIDQMKLTAAAVRHGVVQELEDLHGHLSSGAFSPTLLQTAPSRYYRSSGPCPAWYSALTAAVFRDILAELDDTPKQGKLSLLCTSALPHAAPVSNGPYVVARAIDLKASAAAGSAPATVVYQRRVDRLPPVSVSAIPSDPLSAQDSAPPLHKKPIKYKCSAAGFRDGSVDVISLDSFACQGIAVVRGASKNGIPSRSGGKQPTWAQQLTLSRGGNTEILIFHSAQAAQVVITESDQPLYSHPTSSSPVVRVHRNLEDGDAITVTLKDVSGAVIGEWTLNVFVEDVSDVTQSRFQALVQEHRTGRPATPHAPDVILHRLELSSFLPCADSWKPVLACWSTDAKLLEPISWQGTPTVGDIQPQIDPRPLVVPPQQVLDAREEVRKLLLQQQRCVAEIELHDQQYRAPIEHYLSTYSEWLRDDPASACWLDVIAIHSSVRNEQAGRHIASDEPVVCLLSPLHPLRLAWHVVAQTQLHSSLKNKCPAAGLLSPAQCPDAFSLHLWDGHTTKPRAFFSLPCDHPHWAAFISTHYLDREDARSDAMRNLACLGLHVQSVTGAFTAQQARDSITEVSELLPARATLRVGIVGTNETSSACGEGVFRWGRSLVSADEAARDCRPQLEVYDTRNAEDPTSEQIAELSEATEEKVRWFRPSATTPLPKLDLTIIDQLGARSHTAEQTDVRSAMSSGALCRCRIRADHQNARTIRESRVVRTSLLGSGLEIALPQTVAAFESLALLDSGRAELRFVPNQDAIGSRLNDSIYLAVTSSQIDPACIVRGVIGQHGFLWDYELPGILGSGESTFGYYLIAQPNKAMLDAVARAAALVLSPPPPIPELLEEVSKHGIPILKRLASGGSQSRGELGLLLATRYFQDVFRPSPPRIRLPVMCDTCVHLFLPVDPYEDLFDTLRVSLSTTAFTGQRPDLLAVAIRLSSDNEPCDIKLTPIEVKYRGSPMSVIDQRDALAQASNLGKLCHALWAQKAVTDLWATCSAALLAQLLDFGFRVYSSTDAHQQTPENWASTHERVLRDVLERRARVIVNTAGRLCVFDNSSDTRVADLDGDGRDDTLIMSRDDSRDILASASALSLSAESAFPLLDLSFPDCNTSGGAAPRTTNTANTINIQQPTAAPEEAPTVVAAPEDQSQPPSNSCQTIESPITTTAEPTSATAVIGDDESTVPASGATTVPATIRSRVREAFVGFIGNEGKIAGLSNDLLRALMQEPPHLSKNYLFTGLPSVGKTELARRVAKALGLPFIKLDGSTVTSRDKLFELAAGELSSRGLIASQVGEELGLPVMQYPPLIIFIDEAHLMHRSTQEAFLTLLEAGDRRVVLDDHIAIATRATFLFATTRASDVDPAVVSRCEEVDLREYSVDQVALILRNKAPHETWPDDIYQSLAITGRCVPRIALQLAEQLHTFCLVSETPKSLADHLKDVLYARGIDAKGLTRADYEYLGILERSRGTVGEKQIQNQMRTVDKDRVLNELEPFLARLGFIRHTASGRELTDEGREYLLKSRLDRTALE